MERNQVLRGLDTWKFDTSTFQRKWREVMSKSYITQQRSSFRIFGLNHYKVLSSKHIVILLWVLLLATWLNTNANIDKWKHNIARESLLPISVTENGSKEECVGNVAILLYFMCIFTSIFCIFYYVIPVLIYSCLLQYMRVRRTRIRAGVYELRNSIRAGSFYRFSYRRRIFDKSPISASLFLFIMN